MWPIFDSLQNNPVNYSDPTGNFTLTSAFIFSVIYGTVSGAVFGAIDAAINGQDVAKGAAIGAFYGCLGSVLGGVLGVVGTATRVRGIVSTVGKVASSVFVAAAEENDRQMILEKKKRKEVDKCKVIKRAADNLAISNLCGFSVGKAKSSFNIKNDSIESVAFEAVINPAVDTAVYTARTIKELYF